MRLNLIAEGQTERAFAEQMLGPHLAAYEVYLLKPRLTAFSRHKRSIARGGVRKYVVVRDDVQRWLREDRHDDVRFTTMIDLYALPRDFPGYQEALRAANPYERVAVLEAAWREDLRDPRFIPYIQLHEFEALLLSEPEALAVRFGEFGRAVQRLIELCAAYASPELIDDGQQTAPSKRIGEEIPDYFRAKSTAAPEIAAKIGLAAIRGKCPHFHQWLSSLEALGSSTRQET